MRPFSGLFQMQFTFLQTLHFVTPLKSDSNIGTLVIYFIKYNNI